MSGSNAIRPPGKTEAKLLLLISLTTIAWIGVVFLLDWLPVALTPTAYAIPVILAVCLVLAIRLASKGTATIPLALGMSGCFFVFGGGVFDIVATVIHSAQLRDESNPLARGLLDSGHSLAFVYGYAILSQSLLLALVVTLWLALLRHRNILAASLRGHSSFMRFMKAATGGAHLTWRQWIIPLKMSELPCAYQLFWVLAVALVAGVSDRWYCGLEWFKVVSSIRWIVLGTALIIGYVVYFRWLWLASCRTQPTI